MTKLIKNMKIHFILPFAKNDWPLVVLLKEKFPDASFDCDFVGVSGFGRYRNKIQLFIKTPRLVYFAYKSWMMRIKDYPLPDYVCVGSDVEVIGCLLAQLFTEKKIKIIFIGLIYTSRESTLLRKFRWLYYKMLLSRTYGVICYSKYESTFLSELFGLNNTHFASTLFGGNHNIPKELPIKNGSESGYIVSAGRSGRDYRLLCDSVKDLSIKLHIICDSSHALNGLVCSPNVTILRNCYGHKYIEELAGADLVILPLKDDNVSSGQMVLLDAMALGKVVIITRTATTVEYGEHLKTCYFVKPDSVEEIRSAIDICSRQDVMESISTGAKRYYTEHHSLIPYVNSLVKAIVTLAQNAE